MSHNCLVPTKFEIVISGTESVGFGSAKELKKDGLPLLSEQKLELLIISSRARPLAEA